MPEPNIAPRLPLVRSARVMITSVTLPRSMVNYYCCGSITEHRLYQRTDCEFEYSAPVVKEIEVRLDGLLIPSSDDLSLPLVFLEAQMQTDGNFYGRYFAGIYLYLRQYKPNRPWKSLLYFARS
jgi:Protein of unknown function (DUF2887)